MHVLERFQHLPYEELKMLIRETLRRPDDAMEVSLHEGLCEVDVIFMFPHFGDAAAAVEK